ncbi:MAG TPA: nucleoside triphosphate pyrophosphohydrolase [Flavobacteriales bacterium]|nr:nucleoside triphosphate pyrophosphohydrolase [Flavobacteriales bacterium]HIA12842.1 nucleoside triphosphate pyrophosphohydrolase [Flavobacteriales bacterium]
MKNQRPQHIRDAASEFERLMEIMDELRAKCPWDKKQTFESLRHLTIEETYELADSIIDDDKQGIKGELGDLLLHIVFYAKLGSETDDFSMKEVITTICEKLIHRHPHIYGDVEVQNEQDVKENWEKLKLKEGRSSVLESVPKSLPALVKATRIQDKAKAVGFDWENKDQVWEKVNEELAEFMNETVANQSPEKIEAEFGDLLFSLINYARFIDVNPENALERTNKKFIERFQYLESESAKDGKELGKMTLEEMDKYWDEAKKLEVG